jgi:hypothetical protein
MPTQECRICKGDFFQEPLLRFANMPRVAQFLPDAESLPNDNGVTLEVRQCSGCGLVQLSNDPVPYYKEVIRSSAFSPEMNAFRKNQFSAFISKYSLAGKKVLEIGCGRGEYLSIMQQCDVQAYGLEYAEDSVIHCVNAGLRVSWGFLESPATRLTHAPFDGFCVLSFLEHLPNLNSTLGGIHANLTNEAIGLIEVPNFDMILRNRLFTEFTTDHIFYFTRESLTTTLTINGFELVECAEVWHDYILSAVVRRRNQMDMLHFDLQKAQLQRQVDAYLSRFGAGRVAVWGAGHQALATIALLNLAGKIKYVVDSAPFKQGKYTPATHVPIVSPASLESDPVDAVIVMAASYSDEVARLVREKFPMNMDISILRDFGLELA